ncbi:MAG: hypothetical protein F4047_16205 [Caldilineaceae bacterium SB0670_bin_27]|uniref:Sec-independent protein translocase protein TatB homolog n=1 Tax=Caldilineaceae bacterium SB0664_bin_27 TaxID=2605260 RepID=A0A6B0YXK6_9CHLR|nr:hypothetical protein [Caldilineaceae bacterium SB0664_bin_27]MYJ79647.1 hypothetical protein [Caldilineaceae bacterium SB0670_bin_27]
MNSIFGIGVLEFIFILIFALIFLGPERLPKVTKDVLFFIRRLQRLSGDLTRQVNEEIGDLRELDPSYHMKQLMDDEEEEEEEEEKSIGQVDGQKSTTGTKQTSAPSQPAQAADATAASSGDETVEQTAEQKSAPQPSLSNLNTAASANGRQQSGGSGDSSVKTTGTAIPSAPKTGSASATNRTPSIGATPKRTGSTQKRGVKTLSELRKQQRAKRQSGSSGADSSYLDERNKRAQRRAESRREAVAAQKNEREEASELEDTVTDPVDSGAGDDSGVLAELSSNGEGAADTDVVARESGAESDEGAVAAVVEDADGDGDEETQL